MTDDRQAVKTLAESLVKAMKSVNKTPSHTVVSGVTPSAISASKIVGLPAAFASIISGIESAAADGDAIAQQILTALNHIAAGEFETITADTAMIEKIYATFGDFITLVAEDAQIGNLDVDTIRAGLAEVGLINIGTANIDMAQIKRSSTQTAFIHESVQGQVYIDDLAVSDASIVNLAAGTVLINNSQGELVELYVDDKGDVTTRPVQYSGDGIIIDDSLHGSKIVKNSITTDRLNANEIFAAKSVIMDMIADNIEAARIFANQGFISELESSIISSDLSQNTTIIELTNSINLLATANSTFIQRNMPIPIHDNDTWFDPSTEDHYVANSISLPIQQMTFGCDDDGFLCNGYSKDYQFSIDSNGELAVLFTNAKAEKIITDNNIDFIIVDNMVNANGLWRKEKNVAFSNLRIDVDGISSEVFDPNSGASRITQNANSITLAVQRIEQNESNISTHSSRITQNANNITLAVERISQNESAIEENTSKITQNADSITLAVQRIKNNEDDIETSKTAIEQNTENISLEATKTTNIINGTTAVPYVETSSIKIQNNKIEVKSTGNVDIKASNFSISFNTAGTLTNKSRVDISNTNGIKVSDSYGNYFQATSGKIGLYNIQNTPKVYLDNAGNAHFSGALEAATGTFAGALNAATGTFTGTLSANCITSGTLSAGLIHGGTLTLGGANNANGSIVVYDTGSSSNRVKRAEINSNGITVYDKTGTTRQFYVDTDGNATFAGKMSAECITSGTISTSVLPGGGMSFAESIEAYPQYVISDSSSRVTDNTKWSKTMPTCTSDGQYVWTRVASIITKIDGTNTTKYSAAVYDANLTKALRAFGTATTAQSAANGAVARQQMIYISRPEATELSQQTTWLTNNTGKNGIWTTVRPVYDRSYPVLYVALQRQTVAQQSAGTACSCTTPMIDQTTTVIDGGNIITGSITAGKLAANAVEANNIKAGAITAAKISADGITANVIKGGTLTLGGANNASGSLVVYDGGTTTSTRKKRVEINNTGISVYKSDGTTKQFYVDTDGNATFTGKLGASVVTADNIAAGAISIAKFNNTDKQRIISVDSTLTRQQTIYISKESGTNSVTVNKTWVTELDGKQNTWTTVRPVYSSSYPVLFTAIQRQTNIQHSTSPGTACSCTTPVKDQTTTVISGGSITTGTIDANKVTVTNIDASKINTGYLNASVINTHSLSVDKITGTLGSSTSGSWGINFTNGTMNIGKISANNLTAGTIDASVITVKNIDGSKINASSINASKIKGGALTLGGAENGKGYIVVYDDSDNVIGKWNKNGIEVLSGSIKGGTINGASLTLGGADNGSGSLVVYNNGSTSSTLKKIVEINNTGIIVYKSNGTTKQFYVDTNGNAIFTGKLSAATGTFAGELSAATGTFNGTLSADCITSGTIDASVIIVKNIDGSKINAGSINASKIKGGALTLGGGSNGGNGYIVVYNDSNEVIGRWNKNGIDILSGTINGASLTLGGASNVSGSLVVNNASGTQVGKWDKDGITIKSGSITGGTINGASLTLGGASNVSGSLVVYDNGTTSNRKKRVEINNTGIVVYNSDGTTKQFYVDTDGNATFAGKMSADCITSGTIDANSITVKNINGSNIKTGTINASKIKGGTLTLGGEANGNGSLDIKNNSGNKIFSIDNSGFKASDSGTEIGVFSAPSINPDSLVSGVKVKKGTYVTYLAGGKIVFAIGDTEKKTISISSSGDLNINNVKNTEIGGLTVGSGGVTVTGTLTVNDFDVTGSKSRIVSTSQYSTRHLYCYETPSPLFGDVGEGVISSDGKCYITLDAIFAQTISTDQYQVFLQRYGEGDCYVSERHGSYFVVSGTPNLSFGWELKAKQSDFDQLRLERNDEKFRVPGQSYGEDAANHIRDLYNERTQQSEQSIQESEEAINE